jgi:hypothetical protein
MPDVEDNVVSCVGDGDGPVVDVADGPGLKGSMSKMLMDALRATDKALPWAEEMI